jgi:hypothetical protein
MAIDTHREGFARNSSAEGISKPETRIDINMGAVYDSSCTKMITCLGAGALGPRDSKIGEVLAKYWPK